MTGLGGEVFIICVQPKQQQQQKTQPEAHKWRRLRVLSVVWQVASDRGDAEVCAD